jgi:VRR-NUC domain
MSKLIITFVLNKFITMPNLKSNKREIATLEKYKDLGYNYLTKGYPDFCFYNDNEVIFVEVKRKQRRPSLKMGLSIHQKKMIEIFQRLGLNVRVEYV